VAKCQQKCSSWREQAIEASHSDTPPKKPSSSRHTGLFQRGAPAPPASFARQGSALMRPRCTPADFRTVNFGWGPARRQSPSTAATAKRTTKPPGPNSSGDSRTGSRLRSHPVGIGASPSEDSANIPETRILGGACRHAPGNRTLSFPTSSTCLIG
jgi:hypothetical protein